MELTQKNKLPPVTKQVKIKDVISELDELGTVQTSQDYSTGAIDLEVNSTHK
jgi:hypothetical protein